MNQYQQLSIILFELMKGQLKISNKDRKIKPMKQPVKLQRQQFDQTQSKLHDEHGIKSNIQDSTKLKSGPAIAQSVKPQDIAICTRESVCTDMLAQGNIQAFIDLFYISHNCLPNVMQKKNYFGQILHIPQLSQAKEENLQFWQQFGQSLAKAESRPQSMRQQKQASMHEYNSIAYNYQDQGDYVTASYFYQKVIQLAQACKNQQFQLVALLGLGKCFDQQQQKDRAIQILEDAFDSACIIEDEDQRIELSKLIGKQLIQIYLKKADECEKFNVQLALQAYENSLKIAKRANQKESEARISHKIGQLYYEQGNYERSVQYQEIYIGLLKEPLDQGIQDNEGKQKPSVASIKAKQMEAHASLAKCYLKLKNIQKAENHLNQYNKMAKEAKAQNSVADSSYYLAKLFQEKGESEKSIMYYQSYFEAAKSQKQDKKDRKLVDKARVVYAVAKANRNMDKYIGLFGEQDSLKKILDWKIKRVLK